MIINLFFQDPFAAIVVLTSIIGAIAVHEAAHAYIANWLGDDTPHLQGRLTLNPLVHLDLWGTLLIIFAGIGWGKPVQFNPFNLKHPRRDTALIALAGPTSNIIMAGVVSLVANFILVEFTPFTVVAEYFIFLNIALAVFNLIPIDPLDGFKIVAGILPPGLAYQWEETRRYGLIVLLILFFTGAINNIVFPIVRIISNLLT